MVEKQLDALEKKIDRILDTQGKMNSMLQSHVEKFSAINERCESRYTIITNTNKRLDEVETQVSNVNNTHDKCINDLSHSITESKVKLNYLERHVYILYTGLGAIFMHVLYNYVLKR